MRLLSFFLLVLLMIPTATAFLQPENECEQFLVDVGALLSYDDTQIQNIGIVCEPSTNTTIINNTILNNITVINQTFYIDNSTEKIFNVTQQYQQQPSQINEIGMLLLYRELGLGDFEGKQTQQTQSLTNDTPQIVDLNNKINSLETSIASLKSDIRNPSKSNDETFSQKFGFYIFVIGILALAAYATRKHWIGFVNPPEPTPPHHPQNQTYQPPQTYIHQPQQYQTDKRPAEDFDFDKMQQEEDSAF